MSQTNIHYSNEPETISPCIEHHLEPSLKFMGLDCIHGYFKSLFNVAQARINAWAFEPELKPSPALQARWIRFDQDRVSEI